MDQKKKSSNILWKQRFAPFSPFGPFSPCSLLVWMANALVMADAWEMAGNAVTSACEAAHCLIWTIRHQIWALGFWDPWQLAWKEVFLRPGWRYLPPVQSTWTLKHLLEFLEYFVVFMRTRTRVRVFRIRRLFALQIGWLIPCIQLMVFIWAEFWGRWEFWVEFEVPLLSSVDLSSAGLSSDFLGILLLGVFSCGGGLARSL